MSCDELFKRIEAARAKAEKGEEYQVNIFPFAQISIFDFSFQKTQSWPFCKTFNDNKMEINTS